MTVEVHSPVTGNGAGSPPASGLPAATNGRVERRSYARIPTVLEAPHLVQIQLDSFREFKEEGLEELFTEISPELAQEIGVRNGEWVTISTARASIQARALVTTRMSSLDDNGRRVHHVGLPNHWGYRGLVKGDIVNDLLAISEEPNVRIFESKGLSCNVRKSDVWPGI